ncbi:MAG: hypothetical protein LLG02_10535 [Pelosinus sp.]|nr:hypothetical protein [Pelosinus sp.]
MIAKVEKNYFLDILLGIIGFVCIMTGLIIDFRLQAFLGFFGMVKNLHIWAGYALATLVSLHVLWHFAWLQAMTKSMVKTPWKMWAGVLCAATAIIFCVTVAATSPATKPQHEPGKVTTDSMPKSNEIK